MSKMQTGLAIGVLFALLVFSVPMFINTVNGTTQETLNITENETVDVFSGEFRATNEVQYLNGSPKDNLTLKLTDATTLQQINKTVNETESEKYVLDGGNVTATAEGIGVNASTVKFEYPPTYGWDNSQKRFAGTLGVLFAVTIITVVAGLITKGLNV